MSRYQVTGGRITTLGRLVMGDDSAKAEFRKRIVHILTDPDTLKMNFSFGTRKVDSKAFLKVSAMVQSGAIDVSFGGSSKTRLNRDRAKAEYDDDNDEFIFENADYGSSAILQQAVIVHEAVHAYFDYLGEGKKFIGVDNEAAAYMAEAIYVRRKGLKVPAESVAPALAVADAVVSRLKNMTGAADVAGVADLRATVAAEYHTGVKDTDTVNGLSDRDAVKAGEKIFSDMTKKKK